MVTLLNDAIELVYPDLKSNQDDDNDDSNDDDSNDNSFSIQKLLQQEINKVQNKKHSLSQNVISVNTDIKGIVFAKITVNHVCPKKLVENIFDRIKYNKKQLSKNLVRLTPLVRVFYPSNEEFLENFYDMMLEQYPTVSLPKAKELIDENKRKKNLERLDRKHGEKKVDNPETTDDSHQTTLTDTYDLNENNEGIDGLVNIANDEEVNDIEKNDSSIGDVDEQQATKKQKIEENDVDVEKIEIPKALVHTPITCTLLFKARNHNVLTKSTVQSYVDMCLPSFARLTYNHPQV